MTRIGREPGSKPWKVCCLTRGVAPREPSRGLRFYIGGVCGG